MKKLLDIRVRGVELIFRNRVIRAPVKIEVTDNEFKLLEVQLRRHGINDYSYGPLPVKEIKKPGLWTWGDEEAKIEIDDEEDLEEPTLEELEDVESKTLLERLADKWKSLRFFPRIQTL